MNYKFKITAAGSSKYPFALYQLARPGSWLIDDFWTLVDVFATREEAEAHYEKVKDLPVYLGRMT